MIRFEDTRTPAMKAADLEQAQVRLELQAYREELTREGLRRGRDPLWTNR